MAKKETKEFGVKKKHPTSSSPFQCWVGTRDHTQTLTGYQGGSQGGYDHGSQGNQIPSSAI